MKAAEVLSETVANRIIYGSDRSEADRRDYGETQRRLLPRKLPYGGPRAINNRL